MRNRGRGRKSGRPVIGIGVDSSHIILTITDHGGVIRVTTASPHGLLGSENVTITGTSSVDYNNQTGNITFATSTMFDMGAVLYTGDATGGRWDLT